MSRIGKMPISIPKGVEVKVEGSLVKVKGPKGALERQINDTIEVTLQDGKVVVKPKSENKELSKFFGLSRTLIANMVIGVNEGYTKRLQLVGVGYRAAAKGKGIDFSLGFSHPVYFEAVEGVELKVEKATTIVVTGISKEDVGETAAKIRAIRPPEPYHGKGVRYENEVIKTKVGKAAGKA